MAGFRINFLLKLLIKRLVPSLLISLFSKPVSIKIRRTIKIKSPFFFEYFSKKGKRAISCPLTFLFPWNYFIPGRRWLRGI